MSAIKQPCAKDCPNRSMECRLTCEAYKEYRAAKLEDYKRRANYFADKPEDLRSGSKARRRAIQQQEGRW